MEFLVSLDLRGGLLAPLQYCKPRDYGNSLTQEDKIFAQCSDKIVAEVIALGKEARRCRKCLLYRGSMRSLPEAMLLADIFLLKGAPTRAED